MLGCSGDDKLLWQLTMRLLITFLTLLAFDDSAFGDEPTLNQKLIIACHKLDVFEVITAIRAGGDVNARFGNGDTGVFQDKWFLGSPIASRKWTPLIALANASPYPDPPRAMKSTIEDIDWARLAQKKIPKEQVERRERDRLKILAILVSHKCDLDADDGYGATALYDAIDGRHEEFAKVLLSFHARVNTKTGIYIDGSGDVTPLHRACWSPELTKLLLDKGADPSAKDTSGRSPRDWARSRGVADVIKLYELP